jgi:hypothetical protein
MLCEETVRQGVRQVTRNLADVLIIHNSAQIIVLHYLVTPGGVDRERRMVAHQDKCDRLRSPRPGTRSEFVQHPQGGPRVHVIPAVLDDLRCRSLIVRRSLRIIQNL